MKYGLIYIHPKVYDIALFTLYGGRPQERFRRVAEEIRQGAEVVDLCAGTGMLFNQLRERKVCYRAFDVNPRLVACLRKAGIQAECLDVRKEPIPRADVVTMCSSLYHFYPECGTMLERMIDSAAEKVVVLEPVRNAAHSRYGWVRGLARWMGRVNGESWPFYFTADAFAGLARQVGNLQNMCTLSGGRDMLAVFAGRGQQRI